MFLLNLVFLAVLATSTGQSGERKIVIFIFFWPKVWSIWLNLIYEGSCWKIQHHTPDTLAFTGIPRYIQGQWIIADENLLYEDADGQSVAVEESVWPDRPPEVVELVTVEDQNLLTTPEPYVLKEQGNSSAFWIQSLQHDHQ